jgi:hypothetical protein
MPHVLALLLATAATIVASGCTGRDAQEAQKLIAESQAAFAGAGSATFTARLTMTGGPEELTLSMSGGGYARGKRAGDIYMVATAENLPFNELALIRRSGRVVVRLDGRSLGDVPLGDEGGENPLEVVDFADYVKDVRVEHGKEIDGEAMVKLSGVIDTAAVTHGALGGLAGAGDFDLSQALGETHVVLYLSEASHLPLRGVIDVPMNFAGQKTEMHLDFAYTSYNKKVAFPVLR